MGYLLAGYSMVGACEIDPRMASLYRANLSRFCGSTRGYHFFEAPIQEMKLLVPNPSAYPALESLDVLDGSPPCSSFSTSGNRDKNWGEEKRFREGQATQVLDDLFFHFIELANRLRPRAVVAENVKGLVLGKARGYVKQIFEAMDAAGYDAQLFLLNASKMGVPQRRERTFFIGRRRDLGLPPISLSFTEPEIGVEQAIAGAGGERKPLSEAFAKWWRLSMPGASFSKAHPKGSFFNSYKLHPRRPTNTVTATEASFQCLWDKPVSLSGPEIARVQTFPDDYDFMDQGAKYTCGMSVPPLMAQRIALAIAGWLGRGGANAGPAESCSPA